MDCEAAEGAGKPPLTLIATYEDRTMKETSTNEKNLMGLPHRKDVRYHNTQNLSSMRCYALWVCAVGMRCGYALWVCAVGMRCGYALWVRPSRTIFTNWCYTKLMKRATMTLPDDLAKAV